MLLEDAQLGSPSQNSSSLLTGLNFTFINRQYERARGNATSVLWTPVSIQTFFQFSGIKAFQTRAVLNLIG